MKTIFVKPQDIEKKWYIIDAEGKTLGDVAVAAARLLRGKNKPEFAPHFENGDYVIIINATKAKLSRDKEDTKIYYHHSGYVGGLKRETYKVLLERKPTEPMERAVKGMLPKGPLGRSLFRNLHVYADANHLHTAQKPEVYNF